MTAVTDSEFIALWNTAGSLAAVVAGVSEGAARPVPRWAVLARATPLRQAGLSLREHPDLPHANLYFSSFGTMSFMSSREASS
ncbi:hypothetical protein ETAA1_25000 [Urbifossiella limnaea]|uniref:Uncharacterized protein n=1 Tax=Urbifossiella limnaea TaxID=2528023 RepID=A0A517XSR4_9BACT|nr:hypothetical protein ETAA1_25000 [Urbifossiella limnaea]